MCVCVFQKVTRSQVETRKWGTRVFLIESKCMSKPKKKITVRRKYLSIKKISLPKHHFVLYVIKTGKKTWQTHTRSQPYIKLHCQHHLGDISLVFKFLDP